MVIRTRWRMRGLLLALGVVAGTAALAPAASAAEEQLGPSTTVVSASPTSAVVGEAVVLTATVSCAEPPAGGLGVTFFDGPELLDTVPVDANGQAAHTVTFTTVGGHEITAAYNGNSECSASHDVTTVEVSDAPLPPDPPTPPCDCGDGLLNLFSGDFVLGGNHRGIIGDHNSQSNG